MITKVQIPKALTSNADRSLRQAVYYGTEPAHYLLDRNIGRPLSDNIHEAKKNACVETFTVHVALIFFLGVAMVVGMTPIRIGFIFLLQSLVWQFDCAASYASPSRSSAFLHEVQRRHGHLHRPPQQI